MLACRYCGKDCKSNRSLVRHEIVCKNNPNRIKKKTSNQYIKAKENGTRCIVSDNTRQKLRAASKKQVWTEERRKKHSEYMKQAVLDNPDSYTKNNVCGRVRQIDYNGIKLKGTWELLVAQWLDKNNIKWKSEVNPHKYYWNNSWHLYFPDFYLPEYDFYIEVKGYETERDIEKWKVVDRLIVIKKKEIELIKNDVPVTHLAESVRLITEEAGFESLTEHQ